MQDSKSNPELKNSIISFEARIDRMHQDFYKYYNGLEPKLPDWEGLERELLLFSKKKIFDTVIAKNLDRIMFKFQNRKKIWLNWVEEYHNSLKPKKI
jgi:hypothetical protein